LSLADRSVESPGHASPLADLSRNIS
jgi:hypothetical protein